MNLIQRFPGAVMMSWSSDRPRTWALTVGLFAKPQFRLYNFSDGSIVNLAVRVAWFRAALVFAKSVPRSS